MARVKDLWTVYPDRRGHGKRWLSIWIDPTGRERSQAFSKKSDAERYASRMETEIAQVLTSIRRRPVSLLQSGAQPGWRATPRTVHPLCARQTCTSAGSLSSSAPTRSAACGLPRFAPG